MSNAQLAALASAIAGLVVLAAAQVKHAEWTPPLVEHTHV
jgi:hypothetical protein